MSTRPDVCDHGSLRRSCDLCTLTADLNAAGPVLTAALAWWRCRRPVGWTETEHLEHPEINTATASEQALARAVAAWVQS